MPCTGKERKAFRDRVMILHRQQFGQASCRLCGACMNESALQSHHVLPKNSGGTNNAEENGALVSGRCHVELHDRHTGKLTDIGLMLLDGFRRNSKLRSYGIFVCKRGQR